MSMFSKKFVVALSCSTALVALSAAPALAGVIAPTDKAAVSTETPINSVYYRYGWCHHHHHHHWRAWPTTWVVPAYYPYAGWGWGWGWGPGFGLGLGGLFPFL